jgi:hypothetical protein
MTELKIFSYRSTGPVPKDVAAALAAEVLRPRPDRCWGSAAPRIAAEIGSREPGCCAGSLGAAAAAHEDLLWVLCQLARCARDHHVDFEVRLGELRGRVGTFGLDEGAREMLARSQPCRAHRGRRSRPGRARTPPSSRGRPRLRPSYPGRGAARAARPRKPVEPGAQPPYKADALRLALAPGELFNTLPGPQPDLGPAATMERPHAARSAR